MTATTEKTYKATDITTFGLPMNRLYADWQLQRELQCSKSCGDSEQIPESVLGASHCRFGSACMSLEKLFSLADLILQQVTQGYGHPDPLQMDFTKGLALWTLIVLKRSLCCWWCFIGFTCFSDHLCLCQYHSVLTMICFTSEWIAQCHYT